MKNFKILAILAAFAMSIGSNQNRALASESKKVSDIEVVDQDGKKVNIYSDLIKGKIVGVNFIYTTCKMICIPMSAVFSGTAKLLTEEGLGDRVNLISVTLDPENDTPEKLKEFAKKHKREKGWTLVTGDPVKIRGLLKELGGFEKNIESHGAFTVIGNDLTGEWKKISGIKPPKGLVEEFKKIESKKTETKEAASVSQSEADRKYFSDSIVVDQHGKKHRFYSDLLKNKTVLINFGFTSCNGACPVAIKNLKEALKTLEKDLNKDQYKDLSVIWVSVDKKDSLELIKKFSKKMSIKESNFYLISGDSSEMEGLIQKFGQKVNSPELHSNTVFVGNLKTGTWNKVVSLHGPTDLIKAVISVST